MTQLIDNLIFSRNQKIDQLKKLQEEITSLEYQIASNSCPFHVGQQVFFHDPTGKKHAFMICQIKFLDKPPFYELWASRKLNFGTGSHFHNTIEKIFRPEALIGLRNFQPETSDTFQSRFKKYQNRNYFPDFPPDKV